MSDNGLITITYDPEMFKIVDAIAQEYDVPKSEIFNRAILIASAKVEEKLKTNLSGKILKVVTGHLRQSIDTKIEKDRDGNVITGYPDRNNHHIDAVRYALERIWSRRGE